MALAARGVVRSSGARAGGGPVAPARSRLLDAIAALDARYAGREAETGAGGMGALRDGAGGAQGARSSALLRRASAVPTS